MMSNKTVSKQNNSNINKNTNSQKPEVRKETNMRFPDGRMSKKQAKLFLANTPKDGTQSRSYLKLFSGLSTREPGPSVGGGAFGTRPLSKVA